MHPASGRSGQTLTESTPEIKHRLVLAEERSVVSAHDLNGALEELKDLLLDLLVFALIREPPRVLDHGRVHLETEDALAAEASGEATAPAELGGKSWMLMRRCLLFLPPRVFSSTLLHTRRPSKSTRRRTIASPHREGQ